MLPFVKQRKPCSRCVLGYPPSVIAGVRRAQSQKYSETEANRNQSQIKSATNAETINPPGSVGAIQAQGVAGIRTQPSTVNTIIATNISKPKALMEQAVPISAMIANANSGSSDSVSTTPRMASTPHPQAKSATVEARSGSRFTRIDRSRVA